MLYPGLESWIQKGKAVYKTFVVGGSGVGTIPVIKNRFIVITGFDYFPFTDALSPNDFTTRSVFQLKFRTKKSTNHFIIRNGFQYRAAVNVTFPTQLLPDFQPFHRDTYLVHDENVQIDIVNVPHPGAWTGITYSKLPSISQEKPNPVGYGVLVPGQDAVRKIDFSATENYLPLTTQRDDIPPGAGIRQQFEVDVNGDNRLNIPLQGNSNSSNYNYPIVNVEYVEFQMNLNQFVQASN